MKLRENTILFASTVTMAVTLFLAAMGAPAIAAEKPKAGSSGNAEANQAAEGGTKKRAVLDVQERKRVKRSEKASPQLNKSAVFAVEIERKLIKGIEKTSKYLKKTAKSLPRGSAQRLEILERILNLYMEQSTYVRSEEERAYDKAWQTWNNDGRRGTEPKLENSKSTRYWQMVAEQATEMLDEYPRNKNADVVTFNKAVALAYLGDEKEAARMYTQLIQKYPNSNIAGDAYAALGDFYFDRNDFRNAQTHYDKAMRFRRSKRYLWSVFKSGWCSYNLGKYKDALNLWKRLVMQAKSGNSAEGNLKDEAMRDMVYAFAELRDVEGAIAYYRANNGAKYIGPFLLLLSNILADQGAYKQAIDVLKRFQRVAPYDEEGPNSQKEIISLLYALGQYKPVWKELSRFPAMYGRKSAWAAKNPKKVVIETEAMIKDQILYYSSLTHQKAIKDDNLELNKEARSGYLLFLQSYPTAKEVPGVKYYIADIEYYLKNYREAGRYYLEIASLGKDKAVMYNPQNNKATNIHRTSSVDMVRAFVKDFEPEFKVLKKRTPDFKKPRPLSLRAKNYIKACAKYTEWYPQDKVRIKSCETGITKIYYQSGQKANSVRYLKLLATKYSNAKEGPAAVELLIPLIMDDRKELLAVTDQLLKIESYNKGKVGDNLRGLQRGAEKEAITKEKDTLKRAQKYEAQARKYPKDPDAYKLWYNAAVDYVKAGAIPNAIAAYTVIVQKFPDKPQAEEALLNIAKIHEKQLEYTKASQHFMLFAKKYPKAKETPGALAKSCELLVAIDSENALSVCTGIFNRLPDGGQAYVYQLIISAERKKKYGLMVKLIREHYVPKFKLSSNQRIEINYKIYHAAQGKGGLADAAARDMKAAYQADVANVSGESLRYIGELVYTSTAPVVPKYNAVKLQGGTVDRLAGSIEKKAVALQELEGAMNNVVGTKDAYWGVAALYQMGLANENYALAMENAPAIKGASKEDVLKELGPQIAERRKAAMNWYKIAQDTVTKFKVYNEWSIKILNSIHRVNGQKLVFEDFVVKPDFLGAEVSTSIVSQLKGSH